MEIYIYNSIINYCNGKNQYLMAEIYGMLNVLSKFIDNDNKPKFDYTIFKESSPFMMLCQHYHADKYNDKSHYFNIMKLIIKLHYYNLEFTLPTTGTNEFMYYCQYLNEIAKTDENFVKETFDIFLEEYGYNNIFIANNEKKTILNFLLNNDIDVRTDCLLKILNKWPDILHNDNFPKKLLSETATKNPKIMEFVLNVFTQIVHIKQHDGLNNLSKLSKLSNLSNCNMCEKPNITAKLRCNTNCGHSTLICDECETKISVCPFCRTTGGKFKTIFFM